MIYKRYTLETPLGPLGFAVRGQKVSGDPKVDLKLKEIQPDLPAGMSVDRLVAAVAEVGAEGSLSGLVFDCKWDRIPSAGAPETGEHLDAQSWCSDEWMVMIGTEDVDALSRRHPGLQFTDIPFSASGMEIRLKFKPINTAVSFHFAVGIRHLPDPTGVAAWYAVDIRHEEARKG